MNNILTAQCKLGKQFWAGVSTQNTILVINSKILVPVTTGLSTYVGYIINNIFAITVQNTYEIIYLIKIFLSFLYKYYGIKNISKYHTQ